MVRAVVTSMVKVEASIISECCFSLGMIMICEDVSSVHDVMLILPLISMVVPEEDCR